MFLMHKRQKAVKPSLFFFSWHKRREDLVKRLNAGSTASDEDLPHIKAHSQIKTQEGTFKIHRKNWINLKYILVQKVLWNSYSFSVTYIFQELAEDPMGRHNSGIGIWVGLHLESQNEWCIYEWWDRVKKPKRRQATSKRTVHKES